MFDVEYIVEKVKIVKFCGVSCFCMGVVWWGLKLKDIEIVLNIIYVVKFFGLEICGMFGMLEDGMVEDLKEVGLDYYNYNFDIDLECYNKIIYICFYDDWMDIFGKVCYVGLKICCGGIVGMNEICVEWVGLIVSFVNFDL